MMDRNNPEELYESDHVPDPVAEKAAKEAIEMTDPKKKEHPWITRFAIIMLVILVVLGTFGAVIGAVNSVEVKSAQNQLKDTTSQLKLQEMCTRELVAAFTADSEQKTEIANDDRNAIGNLVKSISKATTSAQVSKAIAVFDDESMKNNKRRALLVKPKSPASCTQSGIQSTLPSKSSSSTSPKKTTKTTAVTTTVTPKSSATKSKAQSAPQVTRPTPTRVSASPSVSSKSVSHPTPTSTPTTVTMSVAPVTVPLLHPVCTLLPILC